MASVLGTWGLRSPIYFPSPGDVTLANEVQRGIEVEHPTLGTVKMAGLIPKLSRTPGKVRHAGPSDIGAFNDEIYGHHFFEKDLDQESSRSS